MVIFSINIPDTLNEELTKLSKEKERSKSFIIRKAIEKYLKYLSEESKEEIETSSAYKAIVSE